MSPSIHCAHAAKNERMRIGGLSRNNNVLEKERRGMLRMLSGQAIICDSQKMPLNHGMLYTDLAMKTKG